MAYKVAKAISLMEVVTDAPRTPHSLAVALHPSVEAQSLLPEVERALKALEEKQVVRDSEARPNDAWAIPIEVCRAYRCHVRLSRARSA
ncbi:MAG TPA: hypothetical protein VMY37_24675 [Thermoguttaceae bacterium]|nr:hypothetical protein [Thermoguttaceae bacterium]